MKNLSKTGLSATLFVIIVTGVSACGKEAAKGSKSAKAKLADPALSTASIDVIKTKPHGMISGDFDPCIYDGSALIAHFGFPADTRASQKAKGRSCHYVLQRMEPSSTALFANFSARLSVVFDHGAWKSVGDPVAHDADITTWLSQGSDFQEIEGLGARTIQTKSPYTGHSEMLSGFPMGGHWSATLTSGGYTDTPWPDAVHSDQWDKFHLLAANLNARLQNPSTVLPQ